MKWKPGWLSSKKQDHYATRNFVVSRTALGLRVFWYPSVHTREAGGRFFPLPGEAKEIELSELKRTVKEGLSVSVEWVNFSFIQESNKKQPAYASKLKQPTLSVEKGQTRWTIDCSEQIWLRKWPRKGNSSGPPVRVWDLPETDETLEELVATLLSE
jgi:hypothetical protein